MKSARQLFSISDAITLLEASTIFQYVLRKLNFPLLAENSPNSYLAQMHLPNPPHRPPPLRAPRIPENMAPRRGPSAFQRHPRQEPPPPRALPGTASRGSHRRLRRAHRETRAKSPGSRPRPPLPGPHLSPRERREGRSLLRGTTGPLPLPAPPLTRCCRRSRREVPPAGAASKSSGAAGQAAEGGGRARGRAVAKRPPLGPGRLPAQGSPPPRCGALGRAGCCCRSLQREAPCSDGIPLPAACEGCRAAASCGHRVPGARPGSPSGPGKGLGRRSQWKHRVLPL